MDIANVPAFIDDVFMACYSWMLWRSFILLNIYWLALNPGYMSLTHENNSQLYNYDNKTITTECPCIFIL